MLASVTHFLPVTLIRRRRLLPASGKVVIRKGQKVSATDVIAEANLAPEHILLDLVRGLGMAADKSDGAIQVRAGDEVGAGDVVAGPVGIARRVVRAPKNGRIVVAGNGQILMQSDSQPFELKAGIPGTVIELFDGRGAEIEANGALVQGTWGNGKIDFGMLNVLMRSPQDDLTIDRLDVSQRGSIILGGSLKDEEVLDMAAEIPLRGMILSSMDSALVDRATKMRIPVLLIEGFGSIPMNTAAFKLLSTSHKREAAVNAEQLDRYSGSQPEVVIPLPSSGEMPAPKDAEEFAPGQKVLLTGFIRKASLIGTITVIRGLMTLESGVRTRAAEVELEGGERTVVPLSNLEVLN